MRYITDEEYSGVKIKSSGIASKGRERNNEFKSFLDKMPVGGKCIITNEEWPHKAKPSSHINTWFTKNGSKKTFSTRTLLDDSGWVVIRVR